MHDDTIIRDHATFRGIVQAMSRPGSVVRLPRREESGRHALLAGLLRCLMDNEVTCHVPDDCADELYREIFRITGSGRAEPETADFLLFPRGTSRGRLAAGRRGTREYPDRGATAVYLVDELAETGGSAELRGPGINGTVRPLIGGLDGAELGLLSEVNAEFPLGLDALFLDNDGRIMCIPRSTRIGVN